jgi:hypothetical protein
MTEASPVESGVSPVSEVGESQTMKRMIRNHRPLRKWLLVAAVGSLTSLGIGVALAQVSPGTSPDIATLLEQFQSLFGTGTGTTTQPSTPTTPPTTSQPGGGSGGRAPTIAQNQFNMTGRTALNARAPGTWIQNAQQAQTDDPEFFTGEGVDTSDGFIKTTLDTIALDVINMFTDLINGLNFLSGFGDLLPGGTPGTGGLGTIPNPTTTGAGTNTPIQ